MGLPRGIAEITKHQSAVDPGVISKPRLTNSDPFQNTLTLTKSNFINGLHIGYEGKNVHSAAPREDYG